MLSLKSPMSIRVKFGLILALTLVAGILAHPREDLVLKKLGLKNAQPKVKLGLDLQGGVHLVYQADLSKVASAEKDRAMESLIAVISRRVNPGGTSEIIVQKGSGNRVIIQCPGQNLCDQDTIGETADLSFIEIPSSDPSGVAAVPTGITGKDVDRADVNFDPSSGQPTVSLKLKGGESTRKFADITTKINKEGGRLVTLLDQDVVFGPATVSSPILDGVAQLQGDFTVDEAKKIARQINAGALPVPMTLEEQRNVGAQLGQESVQRSIVAGIIGLGVVAVFMLLYYRLAGVVAVGALSIYALITLAIYKISPPPLTIVLTLAGIAGFILSIGMAVDANILIFERMKEELRGGKSFVGAVEAGFERAWSSIRDSNMSTLITCLILYNFSGATPIIKGFAVTLGMGVLISMFTAITISRTFLRMLIRTKIGSSPKWYGLKAEEIS